MVITSNANIRIPEIQQRLLERVSKVNENVVVVLFNGRPLDLRDVVSKAKAVLEVWMPDFQQRQRNIFSESPESGELYCRIFIHGI